MTMTEDDKNDFENFSEHFCNSDYLTINNTLKDINKKDNKILQDTGLLLYEMSHRIDGFLT